MKKNVMKKWVAALRSGKYKQGTGQLRENKGNTFCCFGVLCDISKIGRWSAPKILPYLRQKYNYSYKQNTAVLPKEVMKWANLKTGNGGYDAYLPPLAIKNDNGATFEDIADLIEKHWKAL